MSMAEHEVETTPNWAPLKGHLSDAECAKFMWMYRAEGVEYYKHSITRRYLLLDAEGQCLARTAEGLQEILFEDEWERVSGRAVEMNDAA